MGFLAFFPRIFQSETLRVSPKLSHLTKIKINKRKVISSSRLGMTKLEDHYGKAKSSCIMKRCYHSVSCLPEHQDCSKSIPVVNPRDCMKKSLIEKCKNFLISLRMCVVPDVTSPRPDEVMIPHEQVISRIQNENDDIKAGLMETKVTDNKFLFKCYKSEPTLNPAERKSVKHESVFKDVLAMFPLALPQKYKRHVYVDKKKDADYEERIKRMEEMLQALERAGYIQEVDRSIIMQEFTVEPKMTHSAHILPDIDKTTEAMLDYMREKIKVKEAVNQLTVDLSFAADNPDKAAKEKCKTKEILSQTICVDSSAKAAKPKEETKGKKPVFLPPLGPAPQNTPPVRTVPPLPGCKKPKPPKPKSKDN